MHYAIGFAIGITIIAIHIGNREPCQCSRNTTQYGHGGRCGYLGNGSIVDGGNGDGDRHAWVIGEVRFTAVTHIPAIDRTGIVKRYGQRDITRFYPIGIVRIVVDILRGLVIERAIQQFLNIVCRATQCDGSSGIAFNPYTTAFAGDTRSTITNIQRTTGNGQGHHHIAAKRIRFWIANGEIVVHNLGQHILIHLCRGGG